MSQRKSNTKTAESNSALEQISYVAEKRAEQFAKDGIESPAEVAELSVTEILNEYDVSVGETDARRIIESARELVGEDEPVEVDETPQLTNVHAVGEKRADALEDDGVKTVAQLAQIEPDRAYAALVAHSGMMDGVTMDECNAMVESARELADVDDLSSESETQADATDAEVAQAVAQSETDSERSEPSTMSTQSTTNDDEQNSDTINPEALADDVDDSAFGAPDVDNVLVIAGDGELEPKGKEEAIAQLQAAFVASTFEPAQISWVDDGMGSEAIKAWNLKRFENGDLEAELRNPFALDWSDYDKEDPEDNPADVFNERRQRALEWADALLVAANGDYVGGYISEASEMGLEIYGHEEYSPDE